MASSIKGTTIYLTRGDSFYTVVDLFKQIDETTTEPYIPSEGESIRFSMKKMYNDKTLLISKDIPIDTRLLVLKPSDTKDLRFGDYVYDIELIKNDEGDVFTFISGKFVITPEVD